MPAPPALKRRLALAFEFTAPDTTALTASILKQRSETWRLTLTQEARVAGSSKVGIGPSGQDLSVLSQMSRRDAQSITNTFNRELGNQIDRLYDTNPDGNRAYYIAELTQWADNRAEWKDRQIANENRGSARSFAQRRFDEENKVSEALFLFVGPPPREPICAGHFARGLVTQEFVRQNETPIHLFCPHGWGKQSSVIGVPLDQIWVG